MNHLSSKLKIRKIKFFNNNFRNTLEKSELLENALSFSSVGSVTKESFNRISLEIVLSKFVTLGISVVCSGVVTKEIKI